ncbi:MAG: FeoA family protein [Bacillota bacterium]
MEKKIIGLNELGVGRWAIVDSIRSEGLIRRRLMDLGLVPGTRVEVLRASPLGDPRAYRIRGAVIALREDEASKIIVVCRGGME